MLHRLRIQIDVDISCKVSEIDKSKIEVMKQEFGDLTETHFKEREVEVSFWEVRK